MTRFFLATVNVKLDANVIVTVLLSISPMPGRGRTLVLIIVTLIYLRTVNISHKPCQCRNTDNRQHGE